MDVEKKIISILDRYKDEDFIVWAGCQERPEEAVIAAFEKEFEIKLPEEFWEFCLSRFGGFHIEAKKEVWPETNSYAVGPFWFFLYGFSVFGFGDTLPERLDIRVQTKQLREDSGHKIVPFLKVCCDPDCYCFDATGTVLRWDSVMNELNAVGKSFLQVFEDEMRLLRERKDAKKSGSEPE